MKKVLNLVLFFCSLIGIIVNAKFIYNLGIIYDKFNVRLDNGIYNYLDYVTLIIFVLISIISLINLIEFCKKT